jgi:tRNA-Thr(GGU) m(6)t(6)A37 methyltransferase TsaA
MSMDSEFVVRAIGVVASSRDEAIDDDWGAIEATITLHEPYDESSLRGLAEFSHVDVVFLFDRVRLDEVQTGSRVPRGNPAWPDVGIFAQRAKMRPNRIAVTTCELVSVDGATLRVRGLDAIDGSPVLDIKPYMTEFGPRGDVRQPSWSHELMAGYW